MEKVLPEPNSGCWLWLGFVNKQTGYGHINLGGDGPITTAHRVSYELFVRPIPEGLEIDHLCRVHCCVNPKHLEAVTGSVNCLRGISPQFNRDRAKRQTHCKRGHEFTAENTGRNSIRGRVCRKCRAENMRERRLARESS